MDDNRKPDWKHWNARETLMVWEAVALSIDRDPNTLGLGRDPKNTESDAYVRRLAKAAGLAGDSMRFLNGSVEFLNRLETVRRAIALRPDDFVAFPKDPYRGFTPTEKQVVLAVSIRQFFLDRQHGIPEEWTATETVKTVAADNARPAPAVDADSTWAKRARELRDEILRDSPTNRGQKALAARIGARLKAERVTGRGGRAVSETTIIRHVLRGSK